MFGKISSIHRLCLYFKLTFPGYGKLEQSDGYCLISYVNNKPPAAAPFLEQQPELFYLTYLAFLMFFFLLAILVQDHIHGFLRYLVILQIFSNLTIIGVGFLLGG